MQSNYREALIKIINRKISALEDQNFFDFYSESPILFTASDIASFILAIDKLIDVDKSNGDILSRYTLNEDASFIQSIFDNKDFRDYFNNVNISEPHGNNIWFLSAIRNAIAHGGIQYLDLEKKEISIKNNSNLNRIDCTIPLDFFTKFMKKYRELPENAKPIKEFIVELMDNDSDFPFNHKKNGYRLNYMLEVASSEKIDIDLIKSLTEEATKIFDSVIETIYCYDESGEYKEELQEIINKIDSNYHIPKTSFKYKSILNNEVGKFIQEKISSTYPQFQISIRNIKKPLKFNESKPIVKRNLGTETSIDIYRAKIEKNNFLDELLYLQEQFEVNSKYVSTIKEYLTPETQKILFKSNFNGKVWKSRNIVLKSIHKTRSERGLRHSYIDGCFESIDYMDELINLDYKVMEIKNEILDYMKQNSVDRVPEEVKKSFITKYQTFFDNLDKISRNHNSPSPEDIEVYNKLFDDSKLENFIKYSKLKKNRMMIGLLYIYGINVYVTSKEQDSPNETYSGYTNLAYFDLYTSGRTNIVKQQLQSNLNKIETRIIKLSSLVTNPKLPEEIKQKYRESIKDLKAEKQKLNGDAKSIETITVQKKILTMDNNEEKKASVIRNCLAHNGKIKINSRKTSNKGTFLSLIDSDNGNPTALIKCELKDLLKFIELDYRNRFSVKYKTRRPTADSFEELVGSERIAEGVQYVSNQKLLVDNSQVH